MNETFALFIDKATLRDFLAKRVSAEEFTNRAKFTLFDGLDPVGRVPIEVWEDSFNSTYKVDQLPAPERGHLSLSPTRAHSGPAFRRCLAGLTPPGGSASIKITR